MAVEVPGRVLGLDLGDVRIGVAISDDARRLAVPLGTVQVGRPPGELRAIAALVAEHGVTLVVLGLPLSLDGSHGPRAIHAEAFAETLTVARRVCLVYARTWWPVNINADADDFAWLDGDPAIAYLHYGSDRKIRLRRPRVVPG